MNLLTLPGIGHVTQEFIDKLESMASRNGWDAFGLGAIMSFESKFLPHAQNPLPGATATGLIQFTKDTAKNLGTSIADLVNMNAVQQLDYVEKFFADPHNMPKVPSRWEDYELVVLGRGSLVGMSDDTIVYDGRSDNSRIRSAYLGNGAVFDNPNRVPSKDWKPSDGKGYFTVGDVRNVVAANTRGKLGKVAIVAAAGGAELLIWGTLAFLAWKRAKARARGA